jgi:hypothetical protein
VLSEAAAGNRLPTWQVTKAFVEACEGDTGAWEKRWNSARKHPYTPRTVADWQRINIERARHLTGEEIMAVDPQSATLNTVKDSVLPERPNPGIISTVPQLVEALNRLRIWHGKPPLRELARKSGTFAASTLSEALRNKDRLPSYKLVVSFAESCGEPPELVADWKNAWRRLAFRGKGIDGPDTNAKILSTVRSADP